MQRCWSELSSAILPVAPELPFPGKWILALKPIMGSIGWKFLTTLVSTKTHTGYQGGVCHYFPYSWRYFHGVPLKSHAAQTHFCWEVFQPHLDIPNAPLKPPGAGDLKGPSHSHSWCHQNGLTPKPQKFGKDDRIRILNLLKRVGTTFEGCSPASSSHGTPYPIGNGQDRFWPSALSLHSSQGHRDGDKRPMNPPSIPAVTVPSLQHLQHSSASTAHGISRLSPYKQPKTPASASHFLVR